MNSLKPLKKPQRPVRGRLGSLEQPTAGSPSGLAPLSSPSKLGAVKKKGAGSPLLGSPLGSARAGFAPTSALDGSGSLGPIGKKPLRPVGVDGAQPLQPKAPLGNLEGGKPKKPSRPPRQPPRKKNAEPDPTQEDNGQQPSTEPDPALQASAPELGAAMDQSISRSQDRLSERPSESVMSESRTTIISEQQGSEQPEGAEGNDEKASESADELEASLNEEALSGPKEPAPYPEGISDDQIQRLKSDDAHTQRSQTLNEKRRKMREDARLMCPELRITPELHPLFNAVLRNDANELTFTIDQTGIPESAAAFFVDMLELVQEGEIQWSSLHVACSKGAARSVHWLMRRTRSQIFRNLQDQMKALNEARDKFVDEALDRYQEQSHPSWHKVVREAKAFFEWLLAERCRLTRIAELRYEEAWATAIAQRDPEGRTPLHLAAVSNSKSASTLEVLITCSRGKFEESNIPEIQQDLKYWTGMFGCTKQKAKDQDPFYNSWETAAIDHDPSFHYSTTKLHQEMDEVFKAPENPVLFPRGQLFHWRTGKLKQPSAPGKDISLGYSSDLTLHDINPNMAWFQGTNPFTTAQLRIQQRHHYQAKADQQAESLNTIQGAHFQSKHHGPTMVSWFIRHLRTSTINLTKDYLASPRDFLMNTFDDCDSSGRGILRVREFSEALDRLRIKITRATFKEVCRKYKFHSYGFVGIDYERLVDDVFGPKGDDELEEYFLEINQEKKGAILRDKDSDDITQKIQSKSLNAKGTRRLLNRSNRSELSEEKESKSSESAKGEAMEEKSSTTGTRSFEQIVSSNGGYVSLRILEEQRAKCLDIQDDLGRTPLHWASFLGCTKAVETLILHGASKELRAKNGQSALSMASSMEVEALFVRSATESLTNAVKTGVSKHTAKVNAWVGMLDSEAKNLSGIQSFGYTQLHWAVITSDLATVKGILSKSGPRIEDLIKTPDSNGWLPIHHAVSKGGKLNSASYQITSALLGAGADPNARTARKRNTVHVACSNMIFPRVNQSQSAEFNIKKHVLSLLVQHGADLSATDEKGLQPLHVASQTGNAAAAHSILALGAPLMATTPKSWNALHLACFEGHPEVCELLCWYDADAGRLASQKNSSGNTPDTICKNVETANALINGWTAALDCKLHLLEKILQQSLKEPQNLKAPWLNKASIERKSPLNGYTYLHSAILGLARRIRILRKDTVLPKCKRKGHRSIAQINHEMEIEEDKTLSIVKYLIDQNAYVDSLDNRLRTPLMLVCSGGFAILTKHLLSKGADPSASDVAGSTALHYAHAFSSPGCIALLEEAGADTSAQNFTNQLPEDVAGIREKIIPVLPKAKPSLSKDPINDEDTATEAEDINDT